MVNMLFNEPHKKLRAMHECMHVIVCVLCMHMCVCLCVATVNLMKLHGETVWNELHVQARQGKIMALTGGQI